MKRGFASLAVVGVVAAIAVFALNQSPFSGTTLHYSSDTAFAQYLAKHGKSYDTKEEYEMRKALFEARLTEITEHNSQNDQTWFKGVNFFTDMLPHETERMRGYVSDGEHSNHMEVIPDYSFVSAGTPVDWRSKMNSIRHQGYSCGSCWAFAATATIEGRYAIKSGSKVQLSEQQMVDCTSSTDNCVSG